jgi:hypothetical protein
MIDRGGSYRLSLDHYAYVKRSLLAYERATRPALASLQTLTPVLEAIRDMQGVPYERLEEAESRLRLVEKDLGRLSPPQDLAAVHSTFMSTLAMARQACISRRQAVVTNNVQTAREASSAAAGALLLVTQARQDLVTGLYPPKVQ